MLWLSKLLDLILTVLTFWKSQKDQQAAQDKVELEARRQADNIQERSDEIDTEARTLPLPDLANRMHDYQRD
jgi:hypothetical protein